MVWGSQKNGMEITENSHIPPVPKHAQPPYPYPALKWHMHYNWVTTLIHHYCPNSTVYTGVHSWSCTFHGIWQMYHDLHPVSLLCIIPCAPPLSLPPPQPLPTTDLSSVSRMSQSWDHTAWSLFSVAFLSHMHLRSLHVFSRFEVPLSGWHSLFISSPTKGYLDCLQVLVPFLQPLFLYSYPHFVLPSFSWSPLVLCLWFPVAHGTYLRQLT